MSDVARPSVASAVAVGTALAGVLLAWSLPVCLLIAAATQVIAAAVYRVWASRQRCGVTP